VDLGLAGRRVLVTGGTRGIGRAAVLALAAAGAHTVTCHRHESEDSAGLDRRLKELGGRHRLVAADVTERADLARLAEVCRETLGGLDVVVNNAGVDGRAPIEELTPEEWHRVLDVNVTGYYGVLHAVLPLLADGASVINVGASAALRGRPQSAHYTASKAAVIGLTRSLAKELGGHAIRVNTLSPGVVGDDSLPPVLRERLVGMTALRRLATPGDIADVILFLASDLSRYVTGATLDVDGGI
jgi:3-oxoacyl-[acyl-carrier protein] reductase